MGRRAAAAGTDCLTGEGCEPMISGHLLAAWDSPKGTVEAIFYAASFHCNMLKDVSKPIGCQTNEISGVGLVTF